MPNEPTKQDREKAEAFVRSHTFQPTHGDPIMAAVAEAAAQARADYRAEVVAWLRSYDVAIETPLGRVKRTGDPIGQLADALKRGEDGAP